MHEVSLQLLDPDFDQDLDRELSGHLRDLVGATDLK